ncbi:MgtC/SapB family protein [Labrenzia sp. 011]|uniref:MgtC/SapB family protein n=1 Tax=Labrenzia sp. 011 TaxID=2171494 RepID=UPI000D50D0F1|nr:MgtC/SapB family protein [Labrenzia sp. 011]PVB61540.1 MgtC/SapB transporter [Labrenzia sp. 011]
MFEQIQSEFALNFQALPVPIVMVRMIAAILLGGVIGFEREGRGKDAGLRTHMLIALASCLFLLISQELAELSYGGGAEKQVDPLRLVEAVTAGVAFLSAGLIFARNGTVKNVTTGASMWLSGAVGMACGAGQIGLGFVATVLVVIVLAVVGLLERRLPGRSGPPR